MNRKELLGYLVHVAVMLSACEAETMIHSSLQDSASDPSTPSPEATSSPEATPSPVATVPNNLPVTTTGNLVVKAYGTASGSMVASDADGDPLLYSITTPPTQGAISSFDSRTGAYVYSANQYAKGTDQFTFQVTDGKGGAPVTGTVNIQISSFSFLGLSTVFNSTAVIGDGQSLCSGTSFNFIATGTQLQVGDRKIVCGSTTTTFKAMTLDIDGAYLRETGSGSLAGSISAGEVFVSRSATVSGCTATSTLKLSFLNGDFDYSEKLSTTCLPNISFWSLLNANRPIVRLYYAAASPLALGTLQNNSTVERTVVIRNPSEAAATQMSVSAGTAIRFKDAVYPGTGGTCASQLNPSQSCTVIISVDTSQTKQISEQLKLTYFDGASIRTENLTVTAEVVPILVNPTQLSRGLNHTCVIDESKVKCWGANDYGQSTVPALSNPQQVVAGHSMTCAIDGSSIVCWGASYQVRTTIPSVTQPKMIRFGSGSIGYDRACLIDGGTVKCWGANASTVGLTSVPALVNPRAVAVGGAHACALDDSGVKCWGTNTYGQATVPALSNPREIALGEEYSCALDDTGVKCWGRNQYKQTTVPALSNPRTISANYSHSCALDDSGVKCWGTYPTNLGTVPAMASPSLLSTGEYQACAYSGSSVTCW